ncbi:MAG: 4Fe-4S binding protein, partial [Acidobacteria bacterium]|nr:4Fe-4S binding protein [Acidobacteriota bacterium]
KCIQCGLCMNYCPDFAVEVKPKPKKPSAKSKEAVR